MIPRRPLGDLRATDRQQVGGKAWGLARLIEAGLPVPEGVVLPASAFREALEAAEAIGLANRVARRAVPEDVEALRLATLSMELPRDWERDLAGLVEALGGEVAVRSSAVDEDGAERSFAGQHASFLGVGADGVADAVRDCWASLYSASATAYRRGGPAAGAMAVVIQRQVRPRCSGVMFTINPNNGSWREMVVEAVHGLAEPLMSGRVAPQWFVVRRPRTAPRPVERVLARVRLRTMQADHAEQRARCVIGANGQLLEAPLSPHERSMPTLSDAELHRLCRLGLRAERRLGEPLDVEWVLTDGGFSVVQARPITATGEPRGRSDIIWTRRFIGERWPEPATPLGWSLLEPLLNEFIAYPETQARYLGGGPALRLVQSRPYLNATVFRHLAFKLPGSPPPQFMLELVPPEEESQWRRRFAVVPGLAVYASILKTTMEERRWQRFAFNPLTNHRVWDRFRDRLESELPRIARTPNSAGDAVRLVEHQLELVREYVGIHVCSLLFANLLYQLLDSSLAMWLPGRAVGLMEALATCPPGNKTLQTNAALAELSRHCSEADLERLTSGEEPQGPFADRLAEFLKQFGHRSESSWEIMAPRWRSDPHRLAPLLRAQASHHADDPRLRAEEQELAYEQARTELLAHLSGGQRLVAQMLVWYTRRYLLLRENQRFWFDQLLWELRATLLWIGEDLVRREVLATPDDVSFLTWPEVRDLAQGTLRTASVAAWVERRRKERESHAASEPPVFLLGDEAGSAPVAGTRLEGLAISPGRARGVARVLSTVADGQRLGPGEVLVARCVDPGWTPLFPNAAAIVLEMGSVLSHGAVVAREYKIPAVVNIADAVARIRDGQEITVDGTRGKVWIHP